MAKIHLLLCDLGPLCSNFEASVGEFIDYLTTVSAPTERLMEYAEMALGQAARIPWQGGLTRETTRMMRPDAPLDPKRELVDLQNLQELMAMPVGDYVCGQPASTLDWILHTYTHAGSDWAREFGCGVPNEALHALRGWLVKNTPAGVQGASRLVARAALMRLLVDTSESEEDLAHQDFPFHPTDDTGHRMRVLQTHEVCGLLDTLIEIDAGTTVFPMPEAPANTAATPRVRELIQRARATWKHDFKDPVIVEFIG